MTLRDLLAPTPYILPACRAPPGLRGPHSLRYHFKHIPPKALDRRTKLGIQRADPVTLEGFIRSYVRVKTHKPPLRHIRNTPTVIHRPSPNQNRDHWLYEKFQIMIIITHRALLYHYPDFPCYPPAKKKLWRCLLVRQNKNAWSRRAVLGPTEDLAVRLTSKREIIAIEMHT